MTPSTFRSCEISSATTARNRGDVASTAFDCTRTVSSAAVGKASLMRFWAWPDSPTPCWLFWIVFVPAEPPMKTDATTTASQPKIAIFRWCALQCAAREVRFRGTEGSPLSDGELAFGPRRVGVPGLIDGIHTEDVLAEGEPA